MTAEHRARRTGAVGKFSGKAKAAAVAVLVAAVAIGLFAGQRLYAAYQHSRDLSAQLDTDAFYPGVVVEGIDLGGKSMSEAKTAVEAALPSAVEPVDLQITDGNKTWELTGKDLKFQYNTDEVLKEAYAYARSGGREERYRQVQQLKSAPKTYSVKGTVEESSLQSALNTIAGKADVAPKNPSVTAFNTATKQFTYSEGTNGVSVDRDKLLTDAKAVLAKGNTGTVQLSTKTVPFSGSLSGVKAHMKKLGSFSTVSKNSADGTYNMTRALQSVNGTCVKPGATFSFFGTAGPCGKAQGYKPAGAILNGKLVQEYGGGICQASTTIYGAATRSGMKITERHNHSIPSSYCPIGQDATVSYSGMDFKFVNPTDYPVYLVASVTNRVLTVTLYGYQPDDYDSITVSSSVTETIAAPGQAKYVSDSSMAKGSVRLVSKARTGYRVKAQRTYLKNGAAVKTESLPSSYYPAQAACYARGEETEASSPKASSSPSSHASSSGNSSQQSGGGTAANDDVTQEGKPAA